MDGDIGARAESCDVGTEGVGKGAVGIVTRRRAHDTHGVLRIGFDFFEEGCGEHDNDSLMRNYISLAGIDQKKFAR
jgi:hypothetical protein